MTENTKSEFVWRVLGAIIGSFCREFGTEGIRGMLHYMVDYEPMWQVLDIQNDDDQNIPPFKRSGAHDFFKSDNPPQGEKVSK